MNTEIETAIDAITRSNVAMKIAMNGCRPDSSHRAALWQAVALNESDIRALQATTAEPPIAGEVEQALDRMDALLDPELKLLAVSADSVTLQGCRSDMRTIRRALAAPPSPQGEPVGWYDQDHDRIVTARQMHSMKNHQGAAGKKAALTYTVPLWSTAQAMAVPKGLKLVPVEPTESMVDALNEIRTGWLSIREGYDAMLAAAPPAQPTLDGIEAVTDADNERLVRELDVILNGEDGAAIQASLCDIVSQCAREFKNPPFAIAPPAQEPAALRMLTNKECFDTTWPTHAVSSVQLCQDVIRKFLEINRATLEAAGIKTE